MAGVAYLHALGVLYRDLKPENVLLTSKGHVKLADFGLSRNIPHRGRCFTIIGTPEYMAPEQLRGEGYGRPIDWWSLGVVCHELLTGYVPFQAHDAAQVAQIIDENNYE